MPGGRADPTDGDPEIRLSARLRGAEARSVTSACTGALLLGAAGLLEGYAAATHWGFMELLPAFGARPVHERVVIDRNRVTGGGVTAGIDFALRLVGELAGEAVARRIALELEYDPAPPFGPGHPRAAAPELVRAVRDGFAARSAERAAVIERVLGAAAAQ
ncbi:MAG: DJ-1/PfpI family protein [Polyangiaceae bacterium]